MRAVAGVLAAVVCGSAAAADPAAIDAELARITATGSHNKVLHQLQAGVIALDVGEYERAGQILDEALAGITAVYADDPKAAAARGMWRQEGSKDFKGEPYERAMAHYYRGLLDLMRADYDNARAGFEGGLLQDSFAEDDQKRGDFALLLFLKGWTAHAEGRKSLAAELFAEARKLRPDLPVPAADHDLLVIAETGLAPRKLADGLSQNALVYRRGKRFAERYAAIALDGKPEKLYPLEDIYWQAATRGGRQIDRVLAGKAQYRNVADATGSVLSGLSGTASEINAYYEHGASGAIAAVGAVGAVAMLVGSQVQAQADTRYWNNLPDTIHVLTLQRPAGLTEVDLHFFDLQGREVVELARKVPIRTDPKGRSLAWGRSRGAAR